MLETYLNTASRWKHNYYNMLRENFACGDEHRSFYGVVTDFQLSDSLQNYVGIRFD